VLGATGFIGAAVTQVLRQQGHNVVMVRAPRLPKGSTTRFDLAEHLNLEIVDRLVAEISGADAVINAAGNPDASDRDAGVLMASNALLPGLVASAVIKAGVARFVHVSSVAVQGRRLKLDETEQTDPFSPYSRSKAWGEQLVLSQGHGSVVYRPPSVHAVERRVTKAIGRIARSPFGSVARPGTSPSPQALVGNVASAIAYLATTEHSPPSIVLHPAEGITTEGLMWALGGRHPKHLPRWVARAAARGFSAVGWVHPTLAANARRLEVLWFGQEQSTSWLTECGWSPPYGLDSWSALGRQIGSPRP
jgi:nucleoside-diphosphate-sugar epimerase